jgi:signal transduction histidine kinase
MQHADCAPGRTGPEDPPLGETLGTLVLGVLAHTVPGDAYAAWGAAARRASVHLGGLYAARGASAVALALAYRRLLGHTRRLMSPSRQPRTAEQIHWELVIVQAVEELHLVALSAFERGRRLAVSAQLQTAQDDAVRHMAAGLRETLLQSLTVSMGYTELLANQTLTGAERRELLGELLTALERLGAELQRWLRARRYVTQRHDMGFIYLDIERAAEPRAEEGRSTGAI